MRPRHVLALVLLAVAGGTRAQAADLNVITAVEVKDEGASVVLEVKGSKPPNFTTFSMADPPRFVIDLSEAKFQGVSEDMPVNDGTILIVKNLSYGSDATSIARVMIAFVADVEPPDVQAAGNALVVRVAKPGGAPVAQAAPPAQKRAEAEAQAKAEAERRAQEEANARAEAERQAAAEAQARAEVERQAAAEAQARAEAEQKARQEAQAANAQDAARDDAQRRAQEEAEARARAEIEAELKAEAERKAQQQGEAQARAEADRKAQEDAAADAARREAEAQARAEADRKAQEEARQAAAGAEQRTAEQLKQEEARRAKEEYERQRQEAVAAAKAEAERKKLEAQERREAERQAKEQAKLAREEEKQRKVEEARAAREAEKQRREEERLAKLAARDEAKRARDAGAQLSASAPSAQLREVGFRQMPGVSRVFVRASVMPQFTIQDVGPDTVRVELQNTQVKRRNDTRFLDTSFFPSAVAMIAPSRRGSSYVVDIKLKQRVPYQQKVEGDMLAIDFERPGSAPAPGAEAPAAAEGQLPPVEAAPVEAEPPATQR